MTDNAKSSQDDDFIDLSLIIDVLKAQWKVFSSILVFAFILGTVAYFAVPSRWQAEATLRIGKITSLTLDQAGQNSELIESVGEAVARIHLVQFQETIINSSSLQGIDESEIDLIKKTLKAVPVKGTNFIHVSVSGFSPQSAHKTLEVTISTLIAVHKEKMQPAIRQIRDRMDNLSERIALKQKSLVRLKQILQSSGKGDGTNALVLDLLDRQEADLPKLIDERLITEGLLLPPQTFNTSIMDAVRVEDKPYFPQLSLFLVVSILAGGLLGIVAVLYRYRKNSV